MPSTVVRRQNRINLDVGFSYNNLAVSTTYQMQVMDTEVKVDSTSGAFTVTLPPVVECTGINYIIRQTASANAVNIVDKGDSSPALALVLTTTTGAVGIFSDGERWYNDYTVA